MRRLFDLDGAAGGGGAPRVATDGRTQGFWRRIFAALARPKGDPGMCITCGAETDPRYRECEACELERLAM